MATTRVVRYTENSTYQWVPTITTASVVTASPHAHTGVPTGSPFQTDWVDTGTNRECTMLGLGNVSSGNPPNQILFPTNREDGTEAFPDSIDGGNEIRVARYPTTFKITATWPTITADDVLVDHSTGISKTRSSARIQSGGSIRWGARYDELLTDQSLHGEFSGRFRYSTRMHPPAQNAPITDFDETRNGGSDDQASQSLNASQPLSKLFITGSDNITTTTGTTTNDITLSANHNDFTGKTFAADYQNTMTDDTSGGTFQVRVRVSESLFQGTDNNVNIQRKWEALDIVIDASDSDHTLPPFATTTTLAPLGGLVVPADASISTETTMTATGVVKKFGVSTMATTSTVVVETGRKFIITATDLDPLSTTTEVLASLTPLVFGSASFGSTFSTTSVGGHIHGPTLEMASVSAFPTAQGNLIFDITGDYIWDSFNLNTYFEPGFAVDNFALSQGEYSWDFLATTAWDNWPVETWLGDEQTWDNWPDDVWETPFTLDMVTEVSKATPTLKPGGIASLSTTASVVPLGAFSISADATLPVVTQVASSAPGIFDTSALLANSFSVTVSDVDFLENITSDEIEIFASSFSATITGNVITDTTVDIDTALNFTLAIGNVVFDITDSKPSVFSVDVTGNFKTDTSLTLSALASTLQVGTLVEQADPFNTIKIIPETRTIVIPVENRILEVDAENRVNIVSAENRQVEVSQETRVVKLKRQPITNRFSTPRIRSKA